MASAVADDAQSRARRGAGAHGALPRPKDGGKPINRTGQLIAGIGATPSKRDPTRWVVWATGQRGSDDDAKQKKSRARAEQRRRRKARVAAFSASGAGFHMTKRERRRAAGVGKIRVRAVTTNAALLAVLANKPKDKRASAGNRAQYRVLERTPRTDQLARNAGAKVMRYNLISVGKIEVK